VAAQLLIFYDNTLLIYRVPTPPGTSWIFSWKFQDLESPENWRLKSRKVLEKYLWKVRIFISFNGKQAEIVNVLVCVDFYFYLFLKTTTVNILLHATVSAMDYTPNVVWCFFFIFKHSWALKRSWKISYGVPGKSWKSHRFFSSEWVGTLDLVNICLYCYLMWLSPLSEYIWLLTLFKMFRAILFVPCQVRVAASAA